MGTKATKEGEWGEDHGSGLLKYLVALRSQKGSDIRSNGFEQALGAFEAHQVRLAELQITEVCISSLGYVYASLHPG